MCVFDLYARPDMNGKCSKTTAMLTIGKQRHQATAIIAPWIVNVHHSTLETHSNTIYFGLGFGCLISMPLDGERAAEIQ